MFNDALHTFDDVQVGAVNSKSVGGIRLLSVDRVGMNMSTCVVGHANLNRCDMTLFSSANRI